MTKLALSYHHAFFPILTPTSTTHPHPHLSFPSKFRHPHHLPVLRRSLSVVSKAKTKELILGNPSVTVEKGKYSYDVETLINKLSSLPHVAALPAVSTPSRTSSPSPISPMSSRNSRTAAIGSALSASSSICSARYGASPTSIFILSLSGFWDVKDFWISPRRFLMKWWRILSLGPCFLTLQLLMPMVEMDSMRLR
ncbi:UNVERIFIED_CONTAM: Pentatricopeptide repeat-containing protein, chloroplastic [Sesamum angustifolium]|uniref:Pentatricopeptide repeat-containing protein, chloroplastic n=1 Tax=Sesamum angustifolium TaxID=2727405 RepID=A0AAW2JJ54_9LAMI